MDIQETLSRRYRSDPRHRRRKQDDKRTSEQKARANEEQDSRTGGSGHPSLKQREKGTHEVVMTKDHRFYHRRQAQAATRVVTVNVEVVATVDSSGNIVGQETKTPGVPSTPTPGLVDSLGNAIAPVESAVAPAVNAVDSVASAVVNVVDSSVPSTPPVPSLPQVPAVPPFPTDALPQVPAVPPFPSGFSVPAYPYGSAASALALQVSTGLSSSSLGSTVANVSGSSVVSSTSASQSSAANTPSSSPTSSTASLNTASISPSTSVLESPTTMMDFIMSTNTDQSVIGSSTASSNSAFPSPNGGSGVGGGQGNPAAPAAQTSAAVSASSTESAPPLAPPQVVGSVVGSLAGAALILAIVLMLLRRHKRKRKGALQLGNDEPTDRAPPMSQEVSKNNRIPSAFLNRFSGISRSTVDTTTSGGERSFQRVSGRKLPSAFSEGMTSEQFAPGGSSFYQDDNGTYGSSGTPKELGKEAGVAAGAGMMNLRPGPARTPVIRHLDEDPFADPAPFPKERSHLSPPQSPNPEKPRGTLGRSLQSADGSRSSKFTENV